MKIHRRSLRSTARIVTAWLGMLVQLGLAALGIEIIFLNDDPTIALIPLVIWCAIGSAYWVCVVAGLFVMAKDRGEAGIDRRASVSTASVSTGWWSTGWGRVSMIATVASTLLTSGVGIAAAFELLALRSDADLGVLAQIVAVWAMVLSWGLFHWGYARIYYHIYYRADTAPLEFPGTQDPILTDFVYFAFTNATNVSVSDVNVLTSKMRWTVVWHTTISFFLNALIIVLAFNTIMNVDLSGA